MLTRIADKKHIVTKESLTGVVAFLFIIFMASFNHAAAQNRSSFAKDSISINTDPFWKHAIAPAALVGLSAATWPQRENVRSIRNRYAPNFHNTLDNYTQYAPAAAVFALSLSGVKGRNRLGRQAVSLVGSAFIMSVLVNSIKYSTGVERPDGSTRNSFPSGHTATAFMNAAFLHKEYGHASPLYSILGYSMSSYTGISRSLNNRHWVSDILAGAGIGILSTELSYLIIDGFYRNKGDFFTSFDVKREIERPSFVAIKFGQAFYMNGLKSFGKLGLEGAVEGAYFFNKTWGVGGELGFMHIPFKPEAIGATDWDGLPEGLANPQMTAQSLGFPSLMAGGYYSMFLGRKLVLQAKILGGRGTGIGGEMTVTGQTAPNEEPEIHLLAYSVKHCWFAGGGISLTVMMAPALGLSLYADYKYFSPKTAISISKYSGAEDRLLSNERMTINALSGGLKLVTFF